MSTSFYMNISFQIIYNFLFIIAYIIFISALSDIFCNGKSRILLLRFSIYLTKQVENNLTTSISPQYFERSACH